MDLLWVTLALIICSAWAFKHPDRSPADCNFDWTLCGWRNGDASGLQWQHGTRDNFVHDYRWPFLYDPPSGPDKKFIFVQHHHDRDAYNKWVEFSSPLVNVTGDSCLIFDYFNNINNRASNKVMYGSLQLLARFFNKTEKLIKHLRSIDTKSWLRAEVNLPQGEYSLVFLSLYDGEEDTAAAIDDVGLLNTRCGEAIVNRQPGDCAFESGYCGYKQVGPRPLQIYRKEELFEGNRFTPEGNFLAATYRDYSTGSYDWVALKLMSPKLNIITESCLVFARHSSVAGTTGLSVIGLSPNGNWTKFIPKVFSDEWLGSTIPLEPGLEHIVFEIHLSNRFHRGDYIGIDSVEVIPKTCNTVEAEASRLKLNAFACAVHGGELCENNGTCISHGFKSYKCDCKEGYYGNQCQWLSPCDGIKCVHGTCAVKDRKQSECDCIEGEYGIYCNLTGYCSIAPVEIENGNIIGMTNSSYWGRTTYKCNDGYAMVGSNVSICRNGWKHPPSCKAIICGKIPEIANGLFKNDSISQPGRNILPTVSPHLATLNSTVTVQCIEGYEYKGGDSVLRCGENSDWIGTVGTCDSRKECPSPPEVQNGRLSTPASTSVGSLASYECDPGYILIGAGPAHCTSDLRWNFVPECVPHCNVMAGKSGNHEAVTVEITQCSTSNIHVRYPTKENCDDPVKHVIQKGDWQPNDNIRFYGEEVCFSVRTTKSAFAEQHIPTYEYDTHSLPDEEKCETFCLPFENGVKRITVKKYARFHNEITVRRTTVSFVTKGTGYDE